MDIAYIFRDDGQYTADEDRAIYERWTERLGYEPDLADPEPFPLVPDIEPEPEDIRPIETLSWDLYTPVTL